MNACINDVVQIYASAYFDMGYLMKALEILLAKAMDMQCISPCKGGMHLLMADFASIRQLHCKTRPRKLSFESDVSAARNVKQKLSGKECNKALGILSYGCYQALPLPGGAVCWSAVCDSGISWSYSLTFKTYIFCTVLYCKNNITFSDDAHCHLNEV